MSKKPKNEVKEVNWKELETMYKSAAETFIISVNYLKNIYSKYKDLIDKNPNTKKILDGASNTLIGIKKIIDTTALSHIEEATEEDKKHTEVFEGPNGKLLKFKSGPIDENDEKLVESVIKISMSYSNLISSIYTTTKNAIDSILTDLEKVLNEMTDEDERNKYLALLESDKKELKEGDNNGESTKK